MKSAAPTARRVSSRYIESGSVMPMTSAIGNRKSPTSCNDFARTKRPDIRASKRLEDPLQELLDIGLEHRDIRVALVDLLDDALAIDEECRGDRPYVAVGLHDLGVAEQ